MANLKPWYLVKLDRMDKLARGFCAGSILRDIGESILISTLSEDDRRVINAELERMLTECSNVYEQGGISYLKLLRSQIMARPWYVNVLKLMSSYAKDTNGDAAYFLREAIEDVMLSEITDKERACIVATLDSMLSNDGAEYGQKASHELALFRMRLR